MVHLLAREWVETCGTVLGPFTHSRLAYQDFLLCFAQPPRFSAQGLIVKSDAPADSVRALFNLIDDHVQGVPSRFLTSPDLEALVRHAKVFGVLTDANDEQMLQWLFGGRGLREDGPRAEPGPGSDP
jgi:hypothetical protein